MDLVELKQLGPQFHKMPLENFSKIRQRILMPVNIDYLCVSSGVNEVFIHTLDFLK